MWTTVRVITVIAVAAAATIANELLSTNLLLALAREGMQLELAVAMSVFIVTAAAGLALIRILRRGMLWTGVYLMVFALAYAFVLSQFGNPMNDILLYLVISVPVAAVVLLLLNRIFRPRPVVA